MLVDGRELLDAAVKGRFAVGSFNTYNLEITQAILAAAEAAHTPVMLAVGKGALDYGGFGPLSELVLAAARDATVPVAVHLDHSPDVASVVACLQAGFTSVMIDGSKLPLDENIALTRQAVDVAGTVPVEGELGGVAGSEEHSGDQATDIPMTDPGQAERFCRESGVASLAVAIGNAHGFYKGEPHLDFARLEALEDATPVPLVLHGASGLSDDDLRRCIAHGVRKINVNTEMRHALFGALRTGLDEVTGYDVTQLMGRGMVAMQQVVAQKLSVFAG